MIIDLSGLWQADIGDGKFYEMYIPGTLDENQIGYKDTGANQWHPDADLGSDKEIFSGTSEIATRYTRYYTYEGCARIKRRITYDQPKDKRVFLEVERARCLRLFIDGREVPHFHVEQIPVDTQAADSLEKSIEMPVSISTPHIFEVTGMLHGEHEITFLSDNRYPGMPREAILYSSAATDETQTNWNGLLGFVRLREENHAFLSEVRVYPKKLVVTEKPEAQDTVTVKAIVETDGPFEGVLTVVSDALQKSEQVSVSIPSAGRTEVILEHLKLKDDVKRWDIYEGYVYQLTAILEFDSNRRTGHEPEKNTESDPKRNIRCDIEKIAWTEAKNNAEDNSEKVMDSDDKKTVQFGVRDFGGNENGKFAINGRPVFLRCETNCAVFPETGYSPMEADRWLKVLQTYKSYGVNCVRFHSHCPPEAAFTAADQMGMLLQPELSHWNPKDAFESDESNRYYTAELLQILHTYANHPSFVMLTLGNELHASEKGHNRMRTLLALAKKTDSTRLYTDGSNVHYGAIRCEAAGDFYTSMGYYEEHLRGTSDGMRGFVNQSYPDAKQTYDEAMVHLRKTYQKPVFGFEVGQYEVLPDFDELNDFHGISDPANIRIIQKRVEEAGLSDVWKNYVEATGELSLLCYREEVEAALRTEAFSGISLLGLQDFPGQGTALVGMLNSHLQPKPYEFAKPDKFCAFFRAQLPLVLLEKYTYENTEVLKAQVKVANYGKEEIRGRLRYELVAKIPVNYGANENDSAQSGSGENDSVIRHTAMEIIYPVGQLTDAGIIEIPLQSFEKAVRLDLKVTIGEISNQYPIWVYPDVEPVCPSGVYETTAFDENAKAILKEGGTVYLTPPSTKDVLPSSIQAQFSTDFWSVGTFPHQEGGMGQYIDATHPIFKNFPTESHTNWQWWPMAVQRAVILPERYRAIITEMDSYAYLRPMAQLLECRCGNGKLLFSSMGLQDLQQYPEARALLSAIYAYLISDSFSPKQEIKPEMIGQLVN